MFKDGRRGAGGGEQNLFLAREALEWTGATMKAARVLSLGHWCPSAPVSTLSGRPVRAPAAPHNTSCLAKHTIRLAWHLPNSSPRVPSRKHSLASLRESLGPVPRAGHGLDGRDGEDLQLLIARFFHTSARAEHWSSLWCLISKSGVGIGTNVKTLLGSRCGASSNTTSHMRAELASRHAWGKPECSAALLTSARFSPSQ